MSGTIEILTIREKDGNHTVAIRIEGAKGTRLTWTSSVEEMRAVVSDINQHIAEADRLNGHGR